MISFKDENDVLNYIRINYEKFYASHVYIGGIQSDIDIAKQLYRPEERFRYNGETYNIIQYLGKWHNLLTIDEELKDMYIKPSMINRDNIYEYMLVENAATKEVSIVYKLIALDNIIIKEDN